MLLAGCAAKLAPLRAVGEYHVCYDVNNVSATTRQLFHKWSCRLPGIVCSPNVRVTLGHAGLQVYKAVLDQEQIVAVKFLTPLVKGSAHPDVKFANEIHIM